MDQEEIKKSKFRAVILQIVLIEEELVTKSVINPSSWYEKWF